MPCGKHKRKQQSIICFMCIKWNIFLLLISLLILVIYYKEEKSFKDASLSSDILYNVHRSLMQDRSHVNISSGSIKNKEFID